MRDLNFQGYLGIDFGFRRLWRVLVIIGFDYGRVYGDFIFSSADV